MPDCSESGGNRQTARRGRRLWLIPVGVGLLVIIICLLWAAGLLRDSRGAQERLAAINSARALPPEENAASIYERLAMSYPFASSDPNERLAVIDGLLEASERDSCYFRLEPTLSACREQGRRLSLMRTWATLLRNAAKEDMAEGRLDTAVEKLLALMQMGRHLQQQPTYISLLVGLGVEGGAWKLLGDYAMHDGVTTADLEATAAIPCQLDENWTEVSRPAREVQPVFTATYRAEFDRWFRSYYGLRQWAKAEWQEFRAEPTIEKMEAHYRRVLTLRRGVRTLVGLRAYRSIHGSWPDSLQHIHGSVPKDALTDPFTGQPLVYRRTEESFCLYSRGPNGLDENGMRGRDGPDDWPIWPP